MNIRQAAAGAAALDAGAIILFSGIGRASHDEGVLGPWGSGLAMTAWPFLVGAGIGWALARGWKAPCAWKPTGLMVWGSTVAWGMLLRLASGQGVQVSFVIVAGTVLAAFLVGWRVMSGFIAKRKGLKG